MKRITIDALHAAYLSALERAKAAYAVTLAREAQDVAAASRDKTGLPDGYWKAAHVAKLRHQAAAAVYEAIGEMMQEDRP